MQLQLFEDDALQAKQEMFQNKILSLSIIQINLKQAGEYVARLSPPENPDSALYLGNLKEAMGTIDDTERSYKKPLQLLHHSGNQVALAEAQNRLTALYLNIDRKAEKSIEKTLQSNPFAYSVKKYQALVLRHNGEILKAAARMEQVKTETNQFWAKQMRNCLYHCADNTGGTNGPKRPDLIPEQYAPVTLCSSIL